MILIVVAAIVALLVTVAWPPHGVRHTDGYYYRTERGDGLRMLSELRTTAKKIVAGAPLSLGRAHALWRIERCVFVERPAARPYLALTTDKGREIELCLDHADRNAMIYVLIHELAHVMSFSVGHTPEFQRNMQTLLRSARRQGLYTSPSDKRVLFCGSRIEVE
jgi:hypothetical protein